MAEAKCKLCGTDAADIEARELDDWLMKLVMERHPGWEQSDGACPKCWEEIGKMKKQAGEMKYE